MKYKVFTKAMKVLIVGTLIIMAFTKGNITDWLIIGLTAGWLICMTAYLIYKRLVPSFMMTQDELSLKYLPIVEQYRIHTMLLVI